MSGLATGAERVYLHEEGITLEDLRQDLQRLTREFGEKGLRVALMIRNEMANPSPKCVFIGMKEGEVISTDLGLFNQLVEEPYQRAKNPWWMKIRDIAAILAQEPQ